MTNYRMFRSAFSGYNKDDVLKYVETQREQHQKDIDDLNARIDELESAAAKNRSVIKSKNEEIEKLLDELDKARKRAGGKLSEMSELVEEMSNNERSLRKDFEGKEAEYKEQILKLEHTIDAGYATFERGKASLADAKVRADKIIEDARVECTYMKEDCEKEIAQYKAQEFEKVDKEVALKKADVEEAMKKLKELHDLIDTTRDRFSEECNNIQYALKVLL